MQLFYKPDVMEVGLDEAGLGTLCCSVYAGAVYWPSNVTHPLIKDSKLLDRRQKLIAYDFIREEAISFGVAKVEAKEVDRINNKQAAIRAMHEAIDKTHIVPDSIIVDGNYFRFYLDRNGDQISHTCIIDGDATYYSIAAASILAKVSHDKEIQELCDLYPDLREKYDLQHNMGYGTQRHCEAIETYGPTQFHRMTFKRVKEFSDNINILERKK